MKNKIEWFYFLSDTNDFKCFKLHKNPYLESTTYNLLTRKIQTIFLNQKEVNRLV